MEIDVLYSDNRQCYDENVQKKTVGNRCTKLLCDQSDFRSATYYSKQLKISNKTVYKDVEAINRVIGQSGCKIVKKPRHGIRMTGNLTERSRARELMGGEESKGWTLMDSGQREFEILRLLVVEDRKLTEDYNLHRQLSLKK